MREQLFAVVIVVCCKTRASKEARGRHSHGAGRGHACAVGGTGPYSMPGAVRRLPTHLERALGNSQLPMSEVQIAAGAAPAAEVARVSARGGQHQDPAAVCQLPGGAECAAGVDAICVPAVPCGAGCGSVEAGGVHELVVADECVWEWTGDWNGVHE